MAKQIVNELSDGTAVEGYVPFFMFDLVQFSASNLTGKVTPNQVEIFGKFAPQLISWPGLQPRPDGLITLICEAADYSGGLTPYVRIQIGHTGTSEATP